MLELSSDKALFVVDCFRAKIAEVSNPATRQSHEQAVDTFLRFMGGTPVTFDDLDEDLLSGWVSSLFYQGYSCNTVKVYLKRLSALYGKLVKDGLIKDNGCFPGVRSKLDDVSTESVEINSDRECFNKLRKLVQSDFSKSPGRRLAKDLVLFAVYNGGMTFENLASYKKTDYNGNDKAVLEIVNRYSKPKNKYLFPLNQSEKTPKQLYRIVSDMFSDVLKKVDINLSLYSSATSMDLWAVAAMHSGVSASDISGCIRQCGAMTDSVFSFAAGTELSEEQKAEIRRHVSEILTKDPDCWYAMQFRRHVDYDMIKDRMKATGIRFKDSFYPMNEIVRRVGRRLVSESRPIIPGLLFFRCKAAALPGIFFHLGDLAWGYRQTRGAHSPYATISQNSIDVYQHTIGKFTTGMQIYPEGTVELKDGDKVEVIGGDFIGRPAKFKKEVVESAKEGADVKRIIYRLKLIGENNIEWVVDIDPRLVNKISDERYEALKDQYNDACYV